MSEPHLVEATRDRPMWLRLPRWFPARPGLAGVHRPEAAAMPGQPVHWGERQARRRFLTRPMVAQRSEAAATPAPPRRRQPWSKRRFPAPVDAKCPAAGAEASGHRWVAAAPQRMRRPARQEEAAAWPPHLGAAAAAESHPVGAAAW
jgi:hypothetical protein